MIHILKELTEIKLGYKIKTRGDCEKLSKLIEVKTDIDISYNTLRRFFGVSKSTTPQIRTLDTIALFNGFPSYAYFQSQYPKEFSWTLREKAYMLINKEDKRELIKFLKGLEKIHIGVIDLFVSIIRELIIKNEITALRNIFNLELLNPNKNNYSELLHLANSVGLLLRKYQTDYSVFTKSKYFNTTIYTLFVDYSSLNRNYGEFAYSNYNTTKDPDLKLFSGLVLELKNLLNNKKIKSNYTHLISKKTHPILLSRYMSIHVINLPKDRKLEVLDFYKKEYCKKNNLAYIYELMFTSIMTKDFELMKWINLNFKQNMTNSKNYKEWHNDLYEYVCLFLNFYLQNKKTTKKQINLVEEFSVRFSYGTFFEIFDCVIKYHANINPKIQLKNYKNLIDELNYPYFSIDYLKSYFTT